MKLLLENFRKFMNEGVHTEDEIIAIPQSDTSYWGHSTNSDPSKWIKTGLRMPSDGMGELALTVVGMPNDGKEFLEHLRTRTTTDYFNLGSFVVVLAIPPRLTAGWGYMPGGAGHGDLHTQGAPMRNVKVLELDSTRVGDDDYFIVPTRFIRGYYDGNKRIFVDNPDWEQNPAPTEFGIAAEKTYQAAMSQREKEVEVDVQPPPPPPASDDIEWGF